jgi:hypothetical protein
MTLDPLDPFTGVTMADVRATIAWHRATTSEALLEAESHVDAIWADIDAERAIQEERASPIGARPEVVALAPESVKAPAKRRGRKRPAGPELPGFGDHAPGLAVDAGPGASPDGKSREIAEGPCNTS